MARSGVWAVRCRAAWTGGRAVGCVEVVGSSAWGRQQRVGASRAQKGEKVEEEVGVGGGEGGRGQLP